MAPSLRFAWRPLLAGAAGIGVALALRSSLNGWIVGVIASIVFILVALAVKAMPPEVRRALRDRSAPVSRRPRVVVVRGHSASPWELGAWEPLTDRYEVAFLLTGRNAYDVSAVGLERDARQGVARPAAARPGR